MTEKNEDLPDPKRDFNVIEEAMKTEKDFNETEATMKAGLVQIEEQLLDAATKLEEEERYLLELSENNAFAQANGFKMVDEESVRKSIEGVREIIRKLKDLKVSFKKILQDHYDLDERRYQSGE